MSVRVETLGGLRIYRDGEELTSLLRKPIQCALLVYLAVERKATKDQLQTLLWPEKTPAKARGSLNNTMYELRSALGLWAELHGDEIRAADWVTTDIADLPRSTDDDTILDRAPALLGTYLDATHLASTPEFEQWVDTRRSALQRQQRRLEKQGVVGRYERGDRDGALRRARAWADRSPLDEEAQYWAIRLEAESGHRGAALDRFQRFQKDFVERHDAQPDDEILRLAERIQAGDISGNLEEGFAEIVVRNPKPEVTQADTPAHAWRPDGGASRRLLKLLGGYVAASWATLQVVDLMLSQYEYLPPGFFDAAVVLAICGLPVVVATAFFHSRPVPEGSFRGLRFVLARWFSWRNAVLGAFAASAAWAAALAGWSMAGRPVDESVAVLAFSAAPNPSAEEEALAFQIANEAARAVERWDAIRVVPQVTLAGPMFDLGLASITIRRMDDGLALARQVEATRLAAITVNLRDDSAFVSTTLVSTRGGRPVRPTVQLASSVGDAAALAERVAHTILGFDTLPILPEDIHRGTTVRAALEAHVNGLRHLERWELVRAEEEFRRAVAADERFSLAYLHLAQTLYWRSARSRQSLLAVGPELGAASARALEFAGDLKERDKLHVQAFFAFQSGDFDRARTLYQRLILQNPTDLHALTLLGGVEYLDPWLRMDGGVVIGPRRDLNHAMQLFEEALRLQPSFDLGYGHLFDIQEEVQSAADGGGCPGYYPPGAQFVAIWDPTTTVPDGAVAYCAVALDSIEFVTRSQLDDLDPALVDQGADRLLAGAMAQLRRWVASASNQSAPKQQMSAAWLRQRRRLRGAPADPRALADSALTYAELALALRPDTVPGDYFSLAMMHLGAGRPHDAARVADRGLEALGADTARAPQGLANLYMATGQPSRALSLVARADGRFYIEDPEHPDSLIAYGEADAVVRRLFVLGATGTTGPPLREAFADLQAAWSGPGYDLRTRRLLMESVALRITPALLLDEAVLREWDEVLTIDDPIWKALATARSAPEVSAGHIAASDLAPSPPPGLGPATMAYLQSVAEARQGRYNDSLARLTRMQSMALPLDPTLFWPAWGLATLADFRRGATYEALGDPEAAAESYRRFLDTRLGDDPLAQPLYQQAQARIARLAASQSAR